MMTVDEIFQSDIQSNRIKTVGLRKRCEGHKKTQMRRRKKIQKGEAKNLSAHGDTSYEACRNLQMTSRIVISVADISGPRVKKHYI